MPPGWSAGASRGPAASSRPRPARAATGFSVARENARIEDIASIWDALALLLEGSASLSGHLRLRVRPDGTAVIEHRRVRRLHESLRNRPVLHLDATLRAELAGTILPDLDVTQIEAAAPHMHLTLVTGSFGKSMLVPSPGLAEDEASRRQNRLRECVEYVRWQAKCHSPGRVLVVSYQAIEEAFNGIPGVATAHFNAIAGIDAYKDVQALISIGRPLPPDTEVEALGGVLRQGARWQLWRLSCRYPDEVGQQTGRPGDAPFRHDRRGSAIGDLRRRACPGDRPGSRCEPDARGSARGPCPR